MVGVVACGLLKELKDRLHLEEIRNADVEGTDVKRLFPDWIHAFGFPVSPGRMWSERRNIRGFLPAGNAPGFGLCAS
jgi:hypothetical protein